MKVAKSNARDMVESHTPFQNHLLAHLPAGVQGRLLPHFERVDMPLGKVLYESREALRHVYFPSDSIVSLLYIMEDGGSGEISVVGNEGLIGIALFMGVKIRRVGQLCSAQVLPIACPDSCSSKNSIATVQ